VSTVWRRWLLALLKVPPPPEPPDDGGEAGLLVFRASRRFLYLQLVKWGFGQAGALIGLLLLFSGDLFGIRIPTGPDFSPPDGGPAAQVAQVVFEWIEILGLLGFFAQMPFTFLLVVLEYEQRCYHLSARSIRIREGVRRIREMTFTYDNIQEMAIQQGPLQRLLGIADLRVRTAGGGASGIEDKRGRAGDASASFHMGYFRGVDDPAHIRETIRARLREQRTRDETASTQPAQEETTGEVAAAETSSAAAAARTMAREARLLRRLLEAGHGAHWHQEPR
jgi:hypothetical protein